ncbi:MAG: hypothetical protein Q9162_001323 [Coniocarpon cinnabarinum]
MAYTCLRLAFAFAPTIYALSDGQYLTPRRLTVRSAGPGLEARQTIPQFCSSGLSCSDCFGSGYTDCPSGSDVDCHNPSDPDSVCNYSDGGSSYTTPTIPPLPSFTNPSAPGANPAQASSPPGVSGGSGVDSQCASSFGSEYVSCGSNACYDPSSDEVCCPDGSHCYSGQTCSSTPGYCCDTYDDDNTCTSTSFNMTLVDSYDPSDSDSSDSAAGAIISSQAATATATQASNSYFTQAATANAQSTGGLRSGDEPTTTASLRSGDATGTSGPRAGGESATTDFALAGAEPMLWSAIGVAVGVIALAID